MITERRADPEKIQQGVFGEMCGRGFSTMVKIGYCYDCEWSLTLDEIADDAHSFERANSKVSSRSQGHAYFNRGHQTTTVYVPFDIHPGPYCEDRDGGDDSGRPATWSTSTTIATATASRASSASPTAVRHSIRADDSQRGALPADREPAHPAPA